MELLSKIQVVEAYVDTVYETGANVPCALLVLSKLIQNPNISKTYGPITSESFRGDYSYTLKSSGNFKSTYDIAKSLEEMAYEMLRALSFTHNDKLKIYISNS